MAVRGESLFTFVLDYRADTNRFDLRAGSISRVGRDGRRRRRWPLCICVSLRGNTRVKTGRIGVADDESKAAVRTWTVTLLRQRVGQSLGTLGHLPAKDKGIKGFQFLSYTPRPAKRPPPQPLQAQGSKHSLVQRGTGTHSRAQGHLGTSCFCPSGG